MSLKANIFGKAYASAQLDKLLYLSDGLTMPFMYDGVDLVNWGIVAPTTAPTAQATSSGSNALDLCDQIWTPVSAVVDVCDAAWTKANASAQLLCTTSADAVGGGASSLTLIGTTVEPIGAYTQLMLHGDGVDGTQNIVDSSAYTRVMSAGVGIIHSATQYVFGGSSIYAPGAGAGRLTTPNTASLAPGTGDWTIEFRIYPTSFANAGVVFELGLYDSFFQTGISARIAATTGIMNFYCFSTATLGPITLTLNTWHTIRLERTAGVIRSFLNGSQAGSDSANVIDMSGAPFASGVSNFMNSNDGTKQFAGFVDEFRYEVGRSLGHTAYIVPTTAYGSLQNLSNNPTGITGLVSYHDVSTTPDLSGYWGLDLWIKSAKPLYNKDISFAVYDTSGAVTELDKWDIEAISPSDWTHIQLPFNNPANLTSVAAIGLLVNQEKGVNAIYIDSVNAIRCRVSLDANERVEGATSVKLEVPGNIPANTLLAYRNITSVDMHLDTIVQFSIRCNKDIGYQALQYLLDDTAGCASPLESLYVTAALAADTWNNVTLSLAAPAGDVAIVSNGLKLIDRNLTPCTIWLDNIRRATTVGGNLTGRYFAWVSYYASKYDRESDLSPLTNVVDLGGQGMALSGIPLSSDPQVDMRKIYRSAAGGTVPYFDSIIKDNTTTILTLNRSDASLQGGERHPSLEAGSGKFNPPPACPYMVQFKNRITMGGSLPYSRGTLTATNGSANFVFNRAEVDDSFIGRKILIDGETVEYVILSANSLTKTLVARPIEDLTAGTYKGVTGAGKTFVILGEENTIFTSYIDDNDVPRPHGFPIDQAQDIWEGTAGDKLTGLGLCGDAMIATKRFSTHLLEGVFPPYTATKISDTVGCVSFKTIAQDENGATMWFAGEVGVAFSEGFRATIISQGISELFDGTHTLAFDQSMFEEAHAVYDSKNRLYYLFLASNGSTKNDSVLILDRHAADQASWRWYYWTGIEAMSSTIVYDTDGVGTILIADYDGFISEMNVGYLDGVISGTTTGTPTGQTANTLTDATAAFYNLNSKLKAVPVILYNTVTGAFEIHRITTNTATQITIADNWIETPGVNHRYYIGAYELAWRSRNFDMTRVTDKHLIMDMVLNHEKTTASNKLRVRVKKNLAGTVVVNQLVELNASEENVLLIRQRIQQMQWELTGFVRGENVVINSIGVRYRARGIR